MSSSDEFDGDTLWVRPLGDGLAQLCFDRRGERVNKFDQRAVAELKRAAAHLARWDGLRGVLCTSAKDGFVVGADINEFTERFAWTEEALAQDVRDCNDAFVAIEDLPVPIVAAVDGWALGGGFEFTLACSLRVLSSRAQVGVPEVKLGLFPGFGGTVRLPRVAGTAVAIEWITTGQPQSAQAAQSAGVADAVCEPAALHETALALLRRAADGEIDWAARNRARKLPLAEPEALRAPLYDHARAALQPGAAEQPAPLAAVEQMARTAGLERDAALVAESVAFARIARTPAAAAAIQAFLQEQEAKRKARRAAATERTPA